MDYNPYAPPTYDRPPAVETPTGEDGFIEGGRSVGAERGTAWLTEGWELVKGNVVSWIVVCVFSIVFSIGVSVVPVVGPLAFGAVTPLFSAGLYLGCRDIREGRPFGVGHLFAGFNHAGDLLVIGLVRLGQGLVLQGVGFVMGVEMGSPFATTTGNPLDLANLKPLLAFLAVSFVLDIPVTMATYYASALVAIRGMRPLAALKNSFLGTSKNILPYVVYCLMLVLLSLAAALPCGLGFLVLVPVMIASVYVGYRDVFFVSQSSS